MEAKNRSEIEAELASIILILWDSLGKTLNFLLPNSWPVFMAAYERLAAPTVNRVYSQARRDQADHLGFDIRAERQPRPDAGSPAAVRNVAREIYESFQRKQLFEQTLRVQGEDTSQAEVVEQWQAEREAAGITTDAHTAGEMDANREIQSQYGVRIVSTWIAEPGACDVCRPLHGTTKLWRMRFPNGPKAHPNCRCHLESSVALF